MRIEAAIEQLTRGECMLTALSEGLTPEQAHWKPTEKAWSVVEVLNHLYDEERDDFRMRLDLTLHAPDKPWPPIDPERWCVERRYNDRDLDESRERFVAERQRSLEWLRTLDEPDWNVVRTHPLLGEMHAGDILLSWLVHDMLHARQLLRLQYLLAGKTWTLFKADYAGKW